MIAPDRLAATHAAAFTSPRPGTETEVADLLASPFCFLVGDETCFALGRAIAGEAELLTIATHPRARRQGRARACLAAWLTTAEEKGAETAFLEVAADTAAAQALYHAAGFAPCGRRAGYYRQGSGPAVDAVLMRRDVTHPAMP